MQCRKTLYYSITAMFTKANGMETIEVVEACRYGKMDPYTRGTGNKTWHSGSAGSSTLMEMFISVNGKMIEQMEKVDIEINPGQYISNYGAVYNGEWIDDKQEGYGEERWKDGAVYKGDYHEGKKEGNGIFIWGDDSTY